MAPIIRYLEVDGLKEACLGFRNTIQQFEKCVYSMENLTSNLLDSWTGLGRNRFETEYVVIKRQLSDITDELYDIYDALVDSQATYIDADETVAKEISAGYEITGGGDV